MVFKFVLVLTCLTGTILASPASKFENQNRIQVGQFQTRQINPTGIVVDDCGSSGRVYEVRVSDCEQSPCELHPGQDYEIEVDFSTRYRGDLWRVLVTAFAGSTSIVVLDENVEAEIQPVEQHTLFYVLPVTDIFAGQAIRVQIQLIEANTEIQEVCISANAYVTLPEPTTTETVL